MVFENNWIVPVLHDGPHKRRMLDPTLKVQLLVFEPRQEPGEQLYGLKIYFDPYMEATNLVAEMTPQEIADDYFRVVPERPMKLVESEESRQVLEIVFLEKIARNTSGETELLLVNEDFDEGFVTKSILLERQQIPFVSDAPYAFILYGLQSYIKPEYWDDIARKRNSRRAADEKITCVTVLIGEIMASQISQATGVPLPSAKNGLVTIATRELQS